MKNILIKTWTIIGLRIFYVLHPIYEKLFNIKLPSTWYELDWIQNHPWELYERFDEPHHFNSFRRQNLAEAAQKVADLKIPGDVIECGVYKGFSAVLILPKNTSQKYFGVDTFKGLTQPTQLDGSYWTLGDLSASYEVVEKKLLEFQTRIILLKGEIPYVFDSPKFKGIKFSFAHIDVDLYEPTRHSLDFIWPRLSPGRVVICDDYGFSTCPGATLAINQFLKKTFDATFVTFSCGGIWIRKNE
jgi:predicted O-methyltransferase YrrM